MSDHNLKAPSQRQQAVEVLAVTLLEMLLQGAAEHRANPPAADAAEPTAIRSHAR